MYVKALAILLLLSGLITGLWKLYDAGGDAREDKLVREWQEEKLALISERDKLRQKAEALIAEDRKTHDAGTQIVERIVDNCIDRDIPADGLRVLEADGILRR